MADEGEFIPSIVNHFQRKDGEVEQLMDEDDDKSNSDDKLMPQEWMSTDCGHLAKTR
jgi:hypothetical protein